MSDVNNDGYYQELDESTANNPSDFEPLIESSGSYAKNKLWQGSAFSTVARYAEISHLSPRQYKNAQDKLHEAERKLEENSHKTLLSQCTPSQTVRCCRVCKLHFIAKKADVKRGWAKFCSKSCKAQKQHWS
jgi:hypothetical protein